MIQVPSETPSFLLLIPSLKQCFSKFDFSDESRESYYFIIPVLLPWAYDSVFVIGSKEMQMPVVLRPQFE